MTCRNLLRHLVPGVLLLGLGLVPAQAEWQRFVIRPGDEDNRVEFLSKEPLESFTGKTSVVSGEILCDPEQLADSIEVRIEVDLASLSTGMKLRDQHMRENHLETAQYPVAVFRGARLAGDAPRSLTAEATTLQLHGVFDLHGHQRPLALAADIARLEDGTLTIACDFLVKLSDHAIKRPKFLIMKLSDEQRVTVRLLARPANDL